MARVDGDQRNCHHWKAALYSVRETACAPCFAPYRPYPDFFMTYPRRGNTRANRASPLPIEALVLSVLILTSGNA
jgi:hypothetical protein